jgi:truncated hemoglobin YjbI
MSSLSTLINDQLLSEIVDVWYEKMRDDYRINRYFYDRPLPEQAAALKGLLYALAGSEATEPERISELADAAFTAAFARGNAKPSLVNNRDFAFLGTLINGDILGDDDGTPNLTLLCPAHSHFLRLQPIDEVYDIALSLLRDALDELNVAEDSATVLMNFVASGKSGVMGRGKPIYDSDDQFMRFRTHG